MNHKTCVAPIKNVQYDDGHDISIIIPTAKYGRNLKGYGNKSLLPFNNTTVIEHQINTIQNVYSKADIIIVINDDGNKIRKLIREKYPTIRCVYNPNICDTNILYSISMGLYTILNNKVLIIPGDIIFNEDSIRGITTGQSKTLIDTNHYISKTKIGIISTNNIVENYCYDIPLKWGKILYLEGNEYRMFEGIATNKDYTKWCFHEGLNKLIEVGGKIRSFYPDSYFIFEIDTPQDIERLKKIKI
jgi:NDP-sugar pyrophosphorylase family protein